MGLVELISFVASQGVFAVLFVWLFYNTRIESNKREDLLRKEIKDTRKEFMISLGDIANSLNGLNSNYSQVNTRVGVIEEKIDEMQKR